ncbi:alpha/beta fold family hydrolase [Nitzschia inconspicua]|uniref:Alpha/beta fold family hydrolase n=1 Tax=Nitzschia inconspicua TaxID=303405 RepID=A0A9K3M5I8_9STRA|nr:alpha/beta fold family hydrolase [Nitzschia inconspicua]
MLGIKLKLRPELLFIVLLSSFPFSTALLTPEFLSNTAQSTLRASDGRDLLLPPPGDKITLPHSQHTSFVLVPGALVKPEQYRDLAHAIQQSSEQAVWISIPAVQPVANPLNIGKTVQDAFARLKRFGFPGTKTFVGGHSLGGAFLPEMLDQIPVGQVEGLIHLGCILSRKAESDKRIQQLPHMVLAGELDGLVRASRVAEDYHRYVVRKQQSTGDDSTKAMLDHAVVLVPGMNHFGFVSGEPPFMDEFRDLRGELSHEAAVQQVASSVSEFIDYHRTQKIERATPLLSKMNETIAYVQPILAAMELEGSFHLGKTPCHLCDESDDPVGCCDDCVEGSPWAAMVQRELAPEGIEYGRVSDEFHQSWWINPFHDPPFYHPSIESGSAKTDNLLVNATSTVVTLSTERSMVLNMETVSEPVYEKSDMYLFDAGFFSNAALELRCKFNSRQAILEAAGKNVPFESECGTCSKMNERTIEWALEQVPESVKRRYLERGTKLVAGKDIEHSVGPSWIWSYMDYRRVDDRTIELDSHIMSTPLDHPVPASGGKLYCKLLSPAKALDWIYTDSLRPATELSTFYHENLASPANFLKYAARETPKRMLEVADPLFLPKTVVRAGLGGLSFASAFSKRR